MKTLTIREARQGLARLETLLSQAGEVTITRRGKPIARVVPVAGSTKAMPSHKKLRGKMSRMRRGSEELVRDERDAR